MKRILFSTFILMIALPNLLFGQGWIKDIPGSSNEVANNFISTSDGNYLFSLNTFNENTQVPQKNYFVKIDPNGNTL